MWITKKCNFSQDTLIQVEVPFEKEIIVELTYTTEHGDNKTNLPIEIHQEDIYGNVFGIEYTKFTTLNVSSNVMKVICRVYTMSPSIHLLLTYAKYDIFKMKNLKCEIHYQE